MKRSAQAVWKGTLKEGGGMVTTQSGVLSQNPYTFKSRFEDESGKSATNPEELIAAAHAGCFAMQLSAFLAENGTPANSLDVTAHVELVPGTGITGSTLSLEGDVPDIDASKFEELANRAKAECPVSQALSAIDITLSSKLL